SQLQGEGATATVQIRSVDWGYRRLRTVTPATVDIRNSDDSLSARILRVALAGVDATSFSLQPPALPRVLAPGEVLSIPVEFQPQREGSLRAQVEVEVEGAQERLTGELQGVGVLPKVEARGYRFQPTPVGQRSAELGNIEIRNVDTLAPLFIAEVRYLDGTTEFPPDAAALAEAQNRVLAVGEVLRIPVAFQPQVAGRRSARVLVVTDAAPGPELNPRVADTVELLGDGIGVTVTPATTDFGRVLTCFSRDTALTLVNGSATAPLRVIAYRIAGDAAAFSIAPQPPFEVPAGGVQELRVRFSPTEARSYTATVQVENEQGVPVEFSLRGEGMVVSLLIGDGTVVDRVLPGTEVTVPLALRVEPQITGTPQETQDLCLRVRYAPDFLQFRQWSMLEGHPSWVWQVQPIAEGELLLRGQGRTSPNVPPMRLGLTFLAYLTLPMERALEVELCPSSLLPRCLVPVVRAPRVRLANVCFMNGRQVRLSGTAGMLQVEPNPVERGTPIRVVAWLTEPATVELELFTAMGRSVASLRQEALPAGEHEFWLPTHSFGSGVYFYRLRVGPTVQTGSFVMLP
ncbi:MAG: choice-of-anchor D domain-containing protein, partial [Chlorobiota bacterium]